MSRPSPVLIHRLHSHAVLPLFDALFGVALTLLAFALPDHLMNSMDIRQLAASLATYLLTGIVVVLYWYKMRRLIEMTRLLLAPQLLLGMASILLIVVMPKLTQLVVMHGAGSGDLFRWTPSQIVNTSFLMFLGLYDGTCLLYGHSLVGHTHLNGRYRILLTQYLRTQILGFAALMTLGFLELATDRFNNEYIFLVPAILLAEEWHLSHQNSRLRRSEL